jgi:hypothetical protein
MIYRRKNTIRIVLLLVTNLPRKNTSRTPKRIPLLRKLAVQVPVATPLRKHKLRIHTYPIIIRKKDGTHRVGGHERDKHSCFIKSKALLCFQQRYLNLWNVYKEQESQSLYNQFDVRKIGLQLKKGEKYYN